MENKLIPMSDFVLSILNNTSPNNFIKGVESMRAYAQFLKQPLALWMFVPCDENNVPLEFIEYEVWTGSDEEYNEYIHKYFEAKSRVLFEGFKVVDYWIENEYGEHLIDLDALTAFSIEDLANWQYDIELTETAKHIYGS